MSELVEVTRVAEALNITRQRVAQLVHEGLPREKDGQYDLGNCMRWYIRYLQARMRHRSGESEPSLGDERRRLLKTQADAAEFDLARMRGEVIPLAVFEQELQSAFAVVRQRLLAIDARLAPKLVGESLAVIKLKVREAMRDVLTTLAKVKRNGNGTGRPRRAPRTGVELGVRGPGTTTGTADQRVGGTQPDNAEGHDAPGGTVDH